MIPRIHQDRSSFAGALLFADDHSPPHDPNKKEKSSLSRTRPPLALTPPEASHAVSMLNPSP